MTLSADEIQDMRDEATLEDNLDECHGRPVGGPGSLSDLLRRAAREIESNRSTRAAAAESLMALAVAGDDLSRPALLLGIAGVVRVLRFGLPPAK